MKLFQNNKKLFYIVFYLILFSGIILRLYNINYDNYWYDEILSYWVSDPRISTSSSFDRHQSIEQLPFLFNLLLKYYFNIFSYNPDNGRYLSFIFSILSILTITKICHNLKKNYSFLFCLFLLCFNIFLIGYSQELRPYSMILFFCSLQLLFFFRLIEESNDKNNKLLIFFSVLINILTVSSHPFTLIIFFSIIFFSFLYSIKFKKNLKKLNFTILYTVIFCSFYYVFYLKNLNPIPTWLEQPELKFYTNFYFSGFFGSRLLGLLHLFLLIYLVVVFFKKFKNEYFNLNIFLIIIFFSYFLPIIYGYIFQPIIFSRYIIFVLIPIIILISYLTFEIKIKKIKNLIIIITVLLTLGNLYTETTIKQFFTKRMHYKPDFISALKDINKSKEKSYTLDISLDKYAENSAHLAIENYVNELKKKLNFHQIYYTSKKEYLISNQKKIWVICLTIISKDKCNNSGGNINSFVLLEKNYPSLKSKLLKKKD